jgi:hypothetical protein
LESGIEESEPVDGSPPRVEVPEESPREPEDTEGPDREPPPDEPPPADPIGDPTLPVDDADPLDGSFPSEMQCGETAEVAVTFLNLGTTQWAPPAHRLVPLVDSSQFYAKTRVKMPPGTTVDPGGTHVFEFEVTSPQETGEYLLEWRMRSDDGLFGTPAEVPVTVICPPPAPEPEGVPPIAPDWSNVLWIHEDISGWEETVTLEASDGPGNSIHITNNGTTCGPGKACWPTFTPSYYSAGEKHANEFVGSVWIFVYQDEMWVAGVFDSILRNQQKAYKENLMDDLKFPGGELKYFVPESGALYGWMVSSATLIPGTLHTVNERSNVSLFIWP